MQTVHRLDEKDIVSILAKHFNVKEKEVLISIIPEITEDKTEYRISSKIVINE